MPAKAQQLVDIDQIREGVVILKNKGMRGVLMSSSLNFALKSDQEKEATIYQFQNFLNSLDFGLQMIVQSRRLNITGYIEKLKTLEKEQKTDLLRMQTTEYRKFIETIIKGGDILAKNFFIVVPFSPFEAQGNQKSSIPFIGGAKPTMKFDEASFQRYKNQLLQRMEFISLGLRRCGLQVVPLTTEELIELFWSLHHPEESEVGYYPEIPPELIT
jgi:hypothetical protein